MQVAFDEPNLKKLNSQLFKNGEKKTLFFEAT